MEPTSTSAVRDGGTCRSRPAPRLLIDEDGIADERFRRSNLDVVEAAVTRFAELYHSLSRSSGQKTYCPTVSGGWPRTRDAWASPRYAVTDTWSSAVSRRSRRRWVSEATTPFICSG